MLKRKIIITGGSGFIGVNACKTFSEAGFQIIAVDNFSRPTSGINAEYIVKNNLAEIVDLDVCSSQEFMNLVVKFKPETILHLSGQVAVTLSIEDPIADFNSNAFGMLSVLEASRKIGGCRVIYSSTNKVYGKLGNLGLQELDSRYAFLSSQVVGISEDQALRPSSPYGCSKAAADSYALDYFDTYSLDTCVLRQSCILGPHQYGIEDQGWVAWIMICALLGNPVSIFGNGKQVRDILYVTDLTDLYYRVATSDLMPERVFNVGGGLDMSLSVLDLISWIQKNKVEKLDYSYSNERAGDQRLFISDNSNAFKVFGWRPTTPLTRALELTWNWLENNIVSIGNSLKRSSTNF